MKKTFYLENFYFSISLFFFALLSMTFIRFLTVFVVEQKLMTLNWGKGLIVFAQGLRFDLLIIGFALMVLVIVNLILSTALYLLRWKMFRYKERKGHVESNETEKSYTKEKTIAAKKITAEEKIFLMLRAVFQKISFIYVSLFIVINALISWIDICFFSDQLRHIRSFDYKDSIVQFASQNLRGFFRNESAVMAWLSVFVLVAVVIYCITNCAKFLKNKKLKDQNQNIIENNKPLKLAIDILLSLIFVGSLARGSWGRHHLELAHSQLFPEQSLNELILNAVWTMNKDESTLQVN